MMFNIDELIDFFAHNSKKLFFPEEWINLDLKFSKSEIFTLLLLDKSNEITMTELAENINAPMSTATGIADRLVKNNYIERARNKEDRRTVILKITKKGNQFVKDMKDVISKYANVIINDLTDEEKEFSFKIIFKIINTLKFQKNNATPKQQEQKIEKIDIE